MNNVLVQDVCEVFIKDKETGKAYFLGITSSNEVSQTVSQEPLRGGIGNPVVGIMQSNKEIKFKVATVFHNDDVFELQSGETFSDSSTLTVMFTESGVLASGGISIEGTPASGTITAFDGAGKSFVGTYALGKVSITGGVEGDYYTVTYPKEVTGKELVLDSKTFPKNYYVELHTIAYDSNENVVTSDIFWIFDKALPDGNFTATYQAGQAQGNEVNFTAQVPVGSSAYGKYIVVPR